MDKSYSKAGKSVEDQTGIRVSGQTVLNIVRKLQPEKIELKEEPKVKRQFASCTSRLTKTMFRTGRKA